MLYMFKRFMSVKATAREPVESGQKRNSFSSIMNDIVEMAMNNSNLVKMSFLTNDRGYEKRRVYDLLNVLCAIGICGKVSSNGYRWNGFGHLHEVVKSLGRELELLAMRSDGLELIRLPESAHIGIVVKHFIWTFLYFGNSSVNIHRATNIMTSNSNARKKVLRRLYLVTHVLEHVNVVRHAAEIGEYELVFDVNETMLDVFANLIKHREFAPESVLSMMNEVDQNYLTWMYRERVRRCPGDKLPVYRVVEGSVAKTDDPMTDQFI